jgi:hypothetical protein
MTLVVLIILAGVVGLFLALLFFVALFERHPPDEFVPCDLDRLPEPSRYFLAVSDSARRLGFEFVGSFKQNRKSRVYGAYVTYWLAPDRKTLLRVDGGKTIRVPEKKMLLTSLMLDNRLLVTTDKVGNRDLSNLTDRKLLTNAHLEELYEYHQKRLAAQPLQPRLWEKERAFQLAESLREMKANRLIELGLARYVDPQRTVWCYSWRGALRIITSLQQATDEGSAQMERRNLKRPGDD